MNSIYLIRVFKVLILCCFGAMFMTAGVWRHIILHSFTDTFFEVGVLVFLTLYLIHTLDSYFLIGLKNLKKYSDSQQVFICAILGALPGCGGAIFVVNQFLQGHVHFAALTAAFVATMGDAVFLLLSSQPLTGIFVIGLLFATSIVTGFVILLLHGNAFMKRPLASKSRITNEQPCQICHQQDDAVKLNKYTPVFYLYKLLELIWLTLCVITAGLLLISWFSIPIAVDHDLHVIVGTAGMVMSLLIWFICDIPLGNLPTETYCEKHNIIHDCIFIMFWVLNSVIFYEILVEIFELDLASIFQSNVYWLPLFGVLVGIIPGCGPQIIVTTMYLNGLIPLSAQIANAISTDGDALLPALAIDHRATVFATIYSLIPAFIVGYIYLLFELY